MKKPSFLRGQPPAKVESTFLHPPTGAMRFRLLPRGGVQVEDSRSLSRDILNRSFPSFSGPVINEISIGLGKIKISCFSPHPDASAKAHPPFSLTVVIDFGFFDFEQEVEFFLSFFQRSSSLMFSLSRSPNSFPSFEANGSSRRQVGFLPFLFSPCSRPPSPPKCGRSDFPIAVEGAAQDPSIVLEQPLSVSH